MPRRDRDDSRRVGRDQSGWYTIDPVAGWETHRIEVLCLVVDGVQRVLGLRLTPHADGTVKAADAVITSHRLRSLPLGSFSELVGEKEARITRTVDSLTEMYGDDPAEWFTEGEVALPPTDMTEVSRLLERIATAPTHKHDPRAATTAEQVAAIYTEALRVGLPGRRTVTERLSIGTRTADRYIALARAQGLLPPRRRDDPRGDD